jgi:FtsZ-interacting cell division protein YlmF
MQPETQTYIQQPVATTTPVRTASTATVVMLSPYDIRTSQIVCDHIREGHIVICNLTNTDKNQRVVDYISGGVYALGGRVEPTPVKTTFVCTPKSVNLVVENQDAEQMGTKVSAL